MIGIVVILGISWLLLHFIERKNLSAFGLMPLKKSSVQFLYGLLTVLLIRLIVLGLESKFKGFEFTTNPDIKFNMILSSFCYHFKSALTEELIYRGALLIILIYRIGPKKAIWVSSVIFGVYHWFSYGLFGEGLVPMIYIFLITGAAGLVWSYCYVKTKSIALALGFHLGANFALSLYLPNQPYGELLYSIQSMAELSEWNQLYVALFSGFAPSILMYFALKIFLKSKLYQNSDAYYYDIGF